MDDWIFRSILGYLTNERVSLDFRLHVFIWLVIIGVALELVSIGWDHHEEWGDWNSARTRKIIPLPAKPKILKLLADLLSVALVVGGIWGELNVDIRSERLETLIGEVNNLRAEFLQRSANSAETSADIAAAAAGLAQDSANKAGADAWDAQGKVIAVGKEATRIHAETIEAEIGLRQYVEQLSLPWTICDPRLGCVEENDPSVRKRWREEVAKFSGTRALIQPLANSGQARDVALGIRNLLIAEGWFPEIVDAEHSSIPNGYIMSGVTLITLEPSPFRYGTPPEVKMVPVQPSKLFRAIGPLMNLLALDLGPNSRMKNIWGVHSELELDDEYSRMLTLHGFRFPPDTMVILVGDRPTPNWIGTNVPFINEPTAKKAAKK